MHVRYSNAYWAEYLLCCLYFNYFQANALKRYFLKGSGIIHIADKAVNILSCNIL